MKHPYAIILFFSTKRNACSFAFANTNNSPVNPFEKRRHPQHSSATKSHRQPLSKWISATSLSAGTNVSGGGGGGGGSSGNSDVRGNVKQQQHNNVFDSTISNEASSSRDVTSYYLIWSPGFMKKFVVTSAGLIGIHVVGWDIQLARIISRKWTGLSVAAHSSSCASSKLANGIIPNFLLPLLSSSCCLLQLLINVFVGAGGCAGFNTVLGPVRPHLLAILVFLNILTGANVRQVLLRFSLALLPEIVNFWNTHAKKRWQQQQKRTMKQQEQQRNENSSSSTMTRAIMMLDIPTMGCVACINKIEGRLRQCSSLMDINIVSATSWLENDRKGGSARVEVIANSQKELEDVSRMVVETIEGAGFEGSTISHLQILSND